ncbi:MAG: XRE family transcriptional regulator [Hyphomicrobium sp.]
MTSAQFKAWRLHMKLTKVKTADMLDISYSSVDAYELGYRRSGDRRAVVVPQTVALACAALSLGVVEYDGSEMGTEI